MMNMRKLESDNVDNIIPHVQDNSFSSFFPTIVEVDNIN